MDCLEDCCLRPKLVTGNNGNEKHTYVCRVTCIAVYWEVSVCIYRVQSVFLRCPPPRLHCFLSSHWPSIRFLSFMAFFIPSIQFFFGLPRALFCFGIHFNAILGSLSSVIPWTWPYHVSWFCSISFIIVSSSPIKVQCTVSHFPLYYRSQYHFICKFKQL